MMAFRVFLVVAWVAVASYTAVVAANHGTGLLAVFFGAMVKMAWPGQFNLDFFDFLVLSGFWLAWRHHFSPSGLGLGVLGLFGGVPVLTAYLLATSFAVNG